MQCYYYNNFGHYARDCYLNNKFNATDKEETQFEHARNNESDEVLLMVKHIWSKIKPMFVS